MAKRFLCYLFPYIVELWAFWMSS